MNLNDLANLGQIIGALAVVISLFYVAHQIRQNTNAVRSATAQAVHEHFASWYRLLANDAELSQITVNGLRDFRKRKKLGSSRLSWPFLSYSQNAFLKWREKMLEPPLWMGWELLIMNLVSGFRGVLKSVLLSCKFIAACEDFFGLTAQLIHSRAIIGYGKSTNFVLSHRHSLWSSVPSALSA